MTAVAALATALAALTVADLDDVVRELPHAACVSLGALCDDRVRAERAERTVRAPVILEPAHLEDGRTILTADEAAAYLRISRDTLYAQVARGELAPLPRPRGGRIRFRRSDLETAAWLANGVPLRYMPPHDPPRRASVAPPARLDATGAGPRARRDGDDRRPMGARGAHRHTHGRGEPWAPGQAAWAGPPKPGPDGSGA